MRILAQKNCLIFQSALIKITSRSRKKSHYNKEYLRTFFKTYVAHVRVRQPMGKHLKKVKRNKFNFLLREPYSLNICSVEHFPIGFKLLIVNSIEWI